MESNDIKKIDILSENSKKENLNLESMHSEIDLENRRPLAKEKCFGLDSQLKEIEENGAVRLNSSLDVDLYTYNELVNNGVPIVEAYMIATTEDPDINKKVRTK